MNAMVKALKSSLKVGSTAHTENNKKIIRYNVFYMFMGAQHEGSPT